MAVVKIRFDCTHYLQVPLAIEEIDKETLQRTLANVSDLPLFWQSFFRFKVFGRSHLEYHAAQFPNEWLNAFALFVLLRFAAALGIEALYLWLAK